MCCCGVSSAKRGFSVVAGGIRVQSISNWCFERKAANLSVLGCFWGQISVVFNLGKPCAIRVLLTEHTYKFLSVLQPPVTATVPAEQTGGVAAQCLLLVCGAFPCFRYDCAALGANLQQPATRWDSRHLAPTHLKHIQHRFGAEWYRVNTTLQLLVCLVNIPTFFIPQL